MKNSDAISMLCLSAQMCEDILDRQACARAAWAIEWWDGVGFVMPSHFADEFASIDDNLADLARDLHGHIIQIYGPAPIELEMKIIQDDDSDWVENWAGPLRPNGPRNVVKKRRQESEMSDPFDMSSGPRF